MITNPPPRRAMGVPGIYLADLLGRFRGNPFALLVFGVALAIIVVVIALTALAPWVAPSPSQGAGASDLSSVFLPPSQAHLFGTDDLGRDILSRVLYGARVSLSTAFLVVAVAVVLGVVIGAAAGYAGGIVETTLMRLTDFFLAFPSLLLAMAIAAIIGPSLKNMIVALAISWWPWYARLVQGQANILRNMPFVRAARISGVRPGLILLRHIIPNTLTPVIIQATSDVGSAIIAAAALSFLGLGVQAPTADWGSMVGLGREYILAQWWYVTFPGAAIFLTAMSFNVLGDSLRDLTDSTARRA